MGVTKNSLIAIAKKNRIKRSSEYTQDEVDLALAWVDDDVSLQGVDKAMQGRGRGGSYTFLACALRQHLRKERK